MTPPFQSLDETIDACKQMGFGPEITAETCWNEGYRLGRSRWHWGPWWWVNVIGWLNTQRQRIFRRFKPDARATPAREAQG